jgi:PHP family Zn ribbon phosphoesterase
MRTLRAELHVHTVLSPCAEVEMIPPLIVAEALELGLELIAITDHNASANVAAVQQAAAGTGLVVLPGMELHTREDVHMLCLFQELDALAALQFEVDRLLPITLNRPDYFGEQFIVDATGDFLGREERLLLVAADLSIEAACEIVHRLGGITIPAHVDRTAFGLIASLGFVPPDLCVDALEVSRHLAPAAARAKFPQLAPYPLIQSGDAHRLNEILGLNQFTLAHRTLAELALALSGSEGRALEVLDIV